jgi:ParB family chromosome partitioning protein
MSTSNIALSQLTVSDKNLRVVAPDKAALKRLMASIATQGILQNLVVVPGDKEQFEVIAGGRRLKALAEQDRIPADYPVPCLVKTDPAEITEISLAENVHHEAMHPADEFVAFARMIAQGSGTEDVAAAFGVTRKVVEKRMTLGRVTPRLLDEYRKGNINLDAVMAFTVCEDHERQLACYKALPGRTWPNAIRSWLLGEAVDASRGIGAFVGKAAYLKAGGAVSGDLFEDTVYLSDTALVCELAQAKLGRAKNKLEKEHPDWKWDQTTLERSEAMNGMVCLYAEHVGVPKKLDAEIEALDKQIMAWEDLYYDDELAEGFDDEESFDKAIAAACAKAEDLEAERGEYLTFTDEQKAYSGCVVTFDTAGTLDLIEGLAIRKDMPKPGQQAQAGNADGGEGEQTEDKPAAKLSQALVDDLGAYRQQIVKAALLRDPAAAADVLHYTLCMQLLSKERWLGRTLQSAHFDVVESRTRLEDTGQGRAFDEIETARAALPLEWLNINAQGERFAAFRKLNTRAKDKLVAFCTTLSLNIGVRGSSADQDLLIEQLAVDFAGYWRPTKENYFSRLNKGQLFGQFGQFGQFGPVFGREWLDWHSDAKKGAVVEGLDERFQQKPGDKDDPRVAWVPEQF